MKIFLILSLLILPSLCAATSTYETKISVPDQTEASKRAAIHKALSEILVKQAKDPNILSHKEIQSILAKAHDYIQSYQYFNEKKRGGWQKFIRVTFDKEDIERILQQASALSVVSIKTPPATPQKATHSAKPMLVWLAVKNSLKDEPELVGFEQGHMIGKLLELAAKQKNIPLLMPALDVEDITLATPENVWKLDKSILNEASDRYGTPHILAGRLLKIENNQWEGKWLFKNRLEWIELETTGETPEANFTNILEAVREKIDTTAPEASAAPGENPEAFLIQVYQINDLDKNNKLLQYLGQLMPVKYIDTLSVQSDSVILEIHAKGGQSAFQQAIERDKKLIPTTVIELDNPHPDTIASSKKKVDLQYDWQEQETVHPTTSEH